MAHASRAAVFAAAVLALSSIQAGAATGSNCGSASWYALGSKTASGEKMNASKLTAAHRSYRFGTMLRVKNPQNGLAVIVRVNDRGPHIKGRMLDLSKAAAGQIGLIQSGVAPVCMEVVSK
jgi:rare lipoprotein A